MRSENLEGVKEAVEAGARVEAAIDEKGARGLRHATGSQVSGTLRWWSGSPGRGRRRVAREGIKSVVSPPCVHSPAPLTQAPGSRHHAYCDAPDD
jgi:hypothetical protein